jgi:transcriptional regulator with XRE-family HTH domain
VHHYAHETDPRRIISALRQARGFRSDRELALAAGINQPTLARYMNGTSQTMEVAQFMALARTLGVTLSELLGEVPLSSSSGVLRELIEAARALPDSQVRALTAAASAWATAEPTSKP